MSKTVIVSVQVDPALKRDAETVFTRLGMSAAEAIALFYAQVALRSGLPFSPAVPNVETEEALQQATEGRDLVEYDDLEELRAHLG